MLAPILPRFLKIFRENSNDRLIVSIKRIVLRSFGRHAISKNYKIAVNGNTTTKSF